MHLPQRLDVDELVDKARALRRTECARVGTGRLELFVKVALRHRASRYPSGARASIDRAFESGLAVRALRDGHDTAGFASSSGLSSEAASWAVDRACSFQAHVTATTPDSDAGLQEIRWDLDAEVDLTDVSRLLAGAAERTHVQWAEVGTTIEILVGPKGWMTVRRRHRFWACLEDGGTQLVAKRGVSGWEALLESGGDELIRASEPEEPESGSLILTSDAAAPVIASLVGAFHAHGSSPWMQSGRGWSLADEPSHPDGLSGGAFDDSGFPASPKVLAKDGLWVANVEGPGTLRRNSYREPPLESPSNLTMLSGISSRQPAGAVVAERCRVLRMSPDLWVLELQLTHRKGLESARHRWLRVHPMALLDACSEPFGCPKVTSDGLIAPGLVFEGLQTD